jgi:hypothetical protein
MVKHLLKDKLNIVIFALIIAAIINWRLTYHVTPRLEILPPVPTKLQAEAASLGDEQAYFRALALQLQMSGDTWGRFTPLKDYDYAELEKWLYLLDELDAKSNFSPSIAAYYYSNTQRSSDVIYLVNYLEHHYDNGDKNEKWWWLAQAVQLANYRLENRPLALRLAYKLSNSGVSKLPRWAQQMPIFIMEKMGEFEQALLFMKDFSKRHDDFSQGEINFMNYFIKNRLKFINEQLNIEPGREGNIENLDDSFGVNLETDGDEKKADTSSK